MIEFSARLRFPVLLLGQLILAIALQAQTVRTFDASSALILFETGTIIVERDGRLVVDIPSAPDKKIELQSGDEVAMAQRKKVSGLEALRALYKETPHGETFKLGVRRNGALQIASLVRDTATAGRRMVIAGGPGGSGGAVRMVTTTGGGPGVSADLVVSRRTGLVVAKRDAGFEIAAILPESGEKATKAGLQPGDRIAAVNGKPIPSADALRELLDSEGKAVVLTVKRGGSTLEITL